MIRDLVVRELGSRLGAEGIAVSVWGGAVAPGPLTSAACHVVFPGAVEAWVSRGAAAERVVCLRGMIKLVLCDRRAGSGTAGEVQELYLGEYRYREVVVPPGVLRGWKAVGDRPAVVFLALEGDAGETEFVSREEAGVPYDWEIVMQ